MDAFLCDLAKARRCILSRTLHRSESFSSWPSCDLSRLEKACCCRRCVLARTLHHSNSCGCVLMRPRKSEALHLVTDASPLRKFFLLALLRAFSFGKSLLLQALHLGTDALPFQEVFMLARPLGPSHGLPHGEYLVVASLFQDTSPIPLES